MVVINFGCSWDLSSLNYTGTDLCAKRVWILQYNRSYCLEIWTRIQDDIQVFTTVRLSLSST
jgi:hypothetical protein